MDVDKHTRCIVCGYSNIHPLKVYEAHTLVKYANCSVVFIKKTPILQQIYIHYKHSTVTIKRYNEPLNKFEALNITDTGSAFKAYFN